MKNDPANNHRTRDNNTSNVIDVLCDLFVFLVEFKEIEQVKSLTL